MLSEVLNTTTVKRLQSLLLSRYGAGLRVKFLMDADAIKNFTQSPSEQEGDLRVLIEVQSKFFAMAEITGSSQLELTEKNSIAHLVKMVLEPTFYNWELEQTSSNKMDDIFKGFELTNNDFWKSEDHSTKTQSEGHGPHVCLGGAILIESFNPHLIHKISMNIHEVLKRWAFVNFKDIQAQISSADQLKQMGSMTIMINDILELTPDQQSLITDFIKNYDEETDPLLLIGTSNNLQELELKWSINETLMTVFKGSHLNADLLPVPHKLLKQTLELWLLAPLHEV